jgi:hypothetical protein
LVQDLTRKRFTVSHTRTEPVMKEGTYVLGLNWNEEGASSLQEGLDFVGDRLRRKTLSKILKTSIQRALVCFLVLVDNLFYRWFCLHRELSQRKKMTIIHTQQQRRQANHRRPRKHLYFDTDNTRFSNQEITLLCTVGISA